MIVEALAHGPLGVQVLELGADLAVLLHLTLNLKKKYLLKIKLFVYSKKYLLKVKMFLESKNICYKFHISVSVCETAVWRDGGMRGEASHCLVH